MYIFLTLHNIIYFAHIDQHHENGATNIYNTKTSYFTFINNNNNNSSITNTNKTTTTKTVIKICQIIRPPVIAEDLQPSPLYFTHRQCIYTHTYSAHKILHMLKKNKIIIFFFCRAYNLPSYL